MIENMCNQILSRNTLFFEQGKQAGSPIVESSPIFILGFPLPSFYKYIRNLLLRENYEVLPFRNDYESFYHCYNLESLSSMLFEILGKVSLCRKGDPFQSPKLGSCLTLRNKLSEETHVLTKQEILLVKGTPVGCPQPVILTQSPFWWYMPCSANMDASEKDYGRCSDMWYLLLTFAKIFSLVVAYQSRVPYQDLLS